MKTKILTLCGLLAFSVLAAAGPITVTPTAGQLIGAQFAADQYNAAAKAEFDSATKAAYEAAQAMLPDGRRTAYDAAKVAQYVPLTPTEYAAWRFSQVLDSYAEAKVRARIADPANQALIEAVARMPESQRNAVLAGLRAQVEK